MEPLTGGCACGSIRYSCTTPASFALHCRCRACQRGSGTGHSSALVVSRATTTLSGNLNFYAQTSDRGTLVERGFCGTCGSPILNRNSGFPDNYYLTAGSLDDPERFTPERVVFTDSGPSWDFQDPSLPS